MYTDLDAYYDALSSYDDYDCVRGCSLEEHDDEDDRRSDPYDYEPDYEPYYEEPEYNEPLPYYEPEYDDDGEPEYDDDGKPDYSIYDDYLSDMAEDYGVDGRDGSLYEGLRDLGLF